MPSYSFFELLAMSAPPAHYLTCERCGKRGASVSAYNPQNVPLCYDCSEAAEEARDAAMDAEVLLPPDGQRPVGMVERYEGYEREVA